MIKEYSVDEINFDINKYDLKCWGIDDDNPMYVFSKEFDTEEELNKNWENINSTVAIEFQSKLENQVSIWNLYLIFLIHESISIESKYKIEKDKFSTRKVVIDNILDVSDENIKNLISNHISFDDLDIKGIIPSREEYSSDSIVYKELSNIDTLNSDKIENILKSLEKDDDNEI